MDNIQEQLTEVQVNQARIEERIKYVADKLESHTLVEETELAKIRQSIENLQTYVHEIHVLGRYSRWIATTVASIIAGWWWIHDKFTWK
jgi:glucose-6-phosphate isomerase